MEIDELNFKERLKAGSDIKEILLKITELNDPSLLKESFLNKPNLLEKRELVENKNSDFLQLTPKTPTLQMGVFEQAELSWKEIENFEFKNLDVDSFYDREMKRINKILL